MTGRSLRGFEDFASEKISKLKLSKLKISKLKISKLKTRKLKIRIAECFSSRRRIVTRTAMLEFATRPSNEINTPPDG